ncbi:rhodanese-like domain-containing protein [Serpentinicella sp. ANB-PHB4]|uniref:rhodanese-like domain-containing protein n=1 Tax=Serpentinicella sp. ANB-PHB4 TaxID=3074076 RepID=UPI00286565D4|nr:rhodanese-like domain-containing protein [Serpentinicella sp. ANB-PHB4]MDR5658498.1 rhodanese-like domain-containing protein [Serpentinicella sp. ANB-PHB4]
MNRWVIIIIVLVLGFYLYNNNKTESGYERMSPEEAKNQLEQNKDIVLLDVRTVEEYNEKHIDGSTLIPLHVLESEVGRKIPKKDQKIIIYCRSGNRSRTAANMLLKKGYNNVYDLGGINSWPYEVNH